MTEEEPSKEQAKEKFDGFRKTKRLLPCQYVPSEYFYHRLWIWSSPTDVDDMYAVKEICESCPLLKECRVLGKDEACGIWGGEYRMYWVDRKDLLHGRLPYS